MQAWIVKHVRLLDLFVNDGERCKRAYYVPRIFWTVECADEAREDMQVPEDWKVVEVEITEK